MYFLPDEKFFTFLEQLENHYTVYLPEKRNEKLYYSLFANNGKEYTIDEVRACEPVKAFFFKAREKVSENFSDTRPRIDQKPFCIVGVKACDLSSFAVQDYVFLTDDDPDPFYKDARTRNFIVSVDCSTALDTCFCLALGVTPYPQDGIPSAGENFDINLSKINGGYVAVVGSDKAASLISDNENLFREATAGQVKQRKERRSLVEKAVKKNISLYKIPSESRLKGQIRKHYTYTFWNQDAVRCVECGACNMVCPTCHCFLLYDQGDAKKTARFKTWDSCLLKGFARVAGGANPRKELWTRLRNRFEKKFDFFPRVLGLNACTGCGRCISACPAKIDIRKVLGRLAGNA